MKPTLSPMDDASDAAGVAWLVHRRWWRGIAVLVGLGLVAAALIVVVRQHDAVTLALAAMRRPAPGLVALLLAGVAGRGP